ncbi:MAG TPA: hydroxymethylbilane synthase [Gammaproteobacteria bacterium]|nr:hydroxymethylbilane synthase [Gammaproteobacteria bacterium]
MDLEIKKITIVSRKSNLALRQADIVKQQLLQLYPTLSIEVLGITTQGDQILDQPLNKIGGKGLFVSELEEHLLQGKAHIAVHSMKDMPARLPAELGLGAILKRADPRDVLISKDYTNIHDLPRGSILGTSSLRRQAQALALNHDLTIKPLRGNVETRIQQMLDGNYTAIILAYAGLERLGLTEWLQHPLDTTHMLPAVGQGALGIEYKLDNTAVKKLIAPLNDELSAACVHAERAMNAVLDGGCQAPIAGLATIKDGQLLLRGLVAEPDGFALFTDMQIGEIHTAHEIGKQVGQQLIAEGAQEILEKCKHQWQGND